MILGQLILSPCARSATLAVDYCAAGGALATCNVRKLEGKCVLRNLSRYDVPNALDAQFQDGCEGGKLVIVAYVALSEATSRMWRRQMAG